MIKLRLKFIRLFNKDFYLKRKKIGGLRFFKDKFAESMAGFLSKANLSLIKLKMDLLWLKKQRIF